MKTIQPTVNLPPVHLIQGQGKFNDILVFDIESEDHLETETETNKPRYDMKVGQDDGAL